METSQYVVIGAGLAGSATAWSLARRGYEVTVLERTEPAALDGSSHGSARIFRYAYPDPFWVDLVVRTRAGFTELEALSNQQLITPSGALDFGSARNPAAVAAALETAGVRHELVPLQAARSRWPGIAMDTDALWHPDAGVIDAQSTVHALLAAAIDAGALITTGWSVHQVARTGTGYRITAGDGRTVDAQRVVVAAGGWLPFLLPRLPLPESFLAALPTLKVMQENAFHFPYRDPAIPWPTFIHKSPQIQTYSLPGGRDAGFGGQKLAEFNGGTHISSAAAQDGRIDPTKTARIVDYVRQHVPGLVPEPYATTTCLFTNTASEDFIIDGVDGITVLSPCSGHGAKFAPLIGEMAADVASGTGSAPERFRVG